MPLDTRNTSSHVDTLVIGGGVIGLSIAYEILKRRASKESPKKLILVDRGPIKQGTSWAAAGMIAPISEADVQPREVVDFGLESRSIYPEFIRQLESLSGLSCGLRQKGLLWVATDADEARMLRHLQDIQASKGVRSTWLSSSALRDREDHLSHRLSGGLEVEGDCDIDPRRLCAALRAAIETLGGVILEGTCAHSILGQEGRGSWRVSFTCVSSKEGAPCSHPQERALADGQAITAERVVLAAGPWAEKNLTSPLPTLGLRPVKGQTLRLRGLADAPLLEAVIRSPRVYIVPAADGVLKIGASVEEQGFDSTPSAGVVMDLLRYAFRLLPGIYDLTLEEIIVGLRPSFPDHMPAIGAFEDPSLEGIFVALGHYRDGILLAPATARHLVDEMERGQPAKALAPFRPDRLIAHEGKSCAIPPH